MKHFLSLERNQVPGTEWWERLALFSIEFPDGHTRYHEAFFCCHCGRIWLRRVWRSRVGMDIEELSWWCSLRNCNQSPFTFYDFPNALDSNNTELQEYLVNEFLSDPRIAGYTSAAGFTDLSPLD